MELLCLLKDATRKALEVNFGPHHCLALDLQGRAKDSFWHMLSDHLKMRSFWRKWTVLQCAYPESMHQVSATNTLPSCGSCWLTREGTTASMQWASHPNSSKAPLPLPKLSCKARWRDQWNWANPRSWAPVHVWNIKNTIPAYTLGDYLSPPKSYPEAFNIPLAEKNRKYCVTLQVTEMPEALQEASTSWVTAVLMVQTVCFSGQWCLL